MSLYGLFPCFVFIIFPIVPEHVAHLCFLQHKSRLHTAKSRLERIRVRICRGKPQHRVKRPLWEEMGGGPTNVSKLQKFDFFPNTSQPCRCVNIFGFMSGMRKLRDQSTWNLKQYKREAKLRTTCHVFHCKRDTHPLFAGFHITDSQQGGRTALAFAHFDTAENRTRGYRCWGEGLCGGT